MIDLAAIALARRDLIPMAKPYGVICRNCDDSIELPNCESVQDIRELIHDGLLDDHICIWETKHGN